MISQQPSESMVVKTLLEMWGITKEHVELELKNFIQETARHELLFWDVEQICKAISFSKAFVEEHILTDPRVKQFERQRGPRGKRVWLYEPTAKAIKEIIMNEWT